MEKSFNVEDAGLTDPIVNVNNPRYESVMDRPEPDNVGSDSSGPYEDASDRYSY